MHVPSAFQSVMHCLHASLNLHAVSPTVLHLLLLLLRYGFVVYSDPAVVDVACAGLNGLKMGDRTLTVRRAAEVRHHWG